MAQSYKFSKVAAVTVLSFALATGTVQAQAVTGETTVTTAKGQTTLEGVVQQAPEGLMTGMSGLGAGGWAAILATLVVAGIIITDDDSTTTTTTTTTGSN